MGLLAKGKQELNERNERAEGYVCLGIRVWVCVYESEKKRTRGRNWESEREK